MADDGFIAESIVVEVNIPADGGSFSCLSTDIQTAIPAVGVALVHDKIDTQQKLQQDRDDREQRIVKQDDLYTQSGRLSSRRQLDNVQETHTSILKPNTKQILQQLRDDREQQITKDGGFYTQSGRLSSKQQWN